MNEMQLNKIKKRADEYATSYFPYEKQFLEREAVVKCCVHVVTETIAELENENAGLKLKLEALEGQTPWKDIKDKSEVIKKLTNAKEIIKKYLSIGVGGKITQNYLDVTKEAEQFLNEVEK